MNANIINLILKNVSNTNSEMLYSDDQTNFTSVMALKKPEYIEENQTKNKTTETNNSKKKQLIDEKTFKTLDEIILNSISLVQELKQIKNIDAESFVVGSIDSKESLNAITQLSLIDLASALKTINTQPNELFDITSVALNQINSILDELNGFFSSLNVNDQNVIKDKFLSKDFFDIRSLKILKKQLSQLGSFATKQLSTKKLELTQSGQLDMFEELTLAQATTLGKLNKITDFLLQLSSLSLKVDPLGKLDQSQFKRIPVNKQLITTTNLANSLSPLVSNLIEDSVFEGEDLLKQISEQILIGKEGLTPIKSESFNEQTLLNVGLVEMQPNSQNLKGINQINQTHQGQLLTLFGSTAWENAFKQQILFFVKNDIHNARLTLTPKDMGLINIQIVLDDNLVKLQLFAANPHVRQSMESSMPSLKEAFNEQGFELEESSINHSGFSDNSNSPQSGVQQSHLSKQGSKDEKQDLIKTNNETPEDTELSLGNNARKAGIDSFV